jgi:hypothetical protein
MLRFLDQLPFPILIVLAILMLKNGQLHRPIDIFDLVFHLAPLLLLGLKWWLSQGRP